VGTGLKRGGASRTRGAEAREERGVTVDEGVMQSTNPTASTA